MELFIAIIILIFKILVFGTLGVLFGCWLLTKFDEYKANHRKVYRIKKTYVDGNEQFYPQYEALIGYDYFYNGNSKVFFNKEENARKFILNDYKSQSVEYIDIDYSKQIDEAHRLENKTA